MAARGSFPAAILAAALAFPAIAGAQVPPVSIEPASISLPVRSDAPITVFFVVRSQAVNLIEGRLEVSVIDGIDTLAYVENDLIVSPGDQLVRMVLPPVDSTNRMGEVGLKVTFEGKGVRVSPPAFSLRVRGQWQRGFVLLISDPGQRMLSRDRLQLADSLRIESWNAEADQTISTFPARVRPEEFPADPLGYCGFDIAILANEGLAELKETQLKAVADWVAAGGSVCVVPGETIFKEYHVRLLNHMARGPAEEVPFALDPTGRIRSAEEAGQKPLLRRHGLGRLAVVRGPLDALLEQKEDLRGMLAFLWKVRRDRLDEFVGKGTFYVQPDSAPTGGPPDPQQLISQAQVQSQTAQANINQAQAKITQAQANKDEAAREKAQAELLQAQAALAQAQTQIQNAYITSRNVSYNTFRLKDHRLAQLPLRSGDQLVTRLMPQGLRFVPMSLIGVILAVYVLLIGPGDWFILGAIRRRKWTWFTFPAVTIALTLATVWLAEWYMQVNDNRRTVTFHDVVSDGRVIRRNRFEVLFLGSEREVKTELAREMFSPMTLQRFSEATWQTFQQAQMQGNEPRKLGPGVARYVGRIPTHYAVCPFITQWTPQLNRSFAIPLAEKTPEFDWSAFADAKTYNIASLASGPGRNELVSRVKQAFGEGANITVFSQGKRQDLAGAFQFFQGEGVYGVDANGNPIRPQYYPGYNFNEKKTNFLDDVCVNSLGGLFAVVSQMSPTGGKDFEDMALLDTSDPDQWLLVIAVDRGDEVDIYRKLYAGEK